MLHRSIRARGALDVHDAVVQPPLEHAAAAVPTETRVPLAQIFVEFLIIGATSFGGVVPYLHGSLVTKRHWLDDKQFVEKLSISQSLPGLNATNMAILVGEKLRGALGSTVAIVGICLPGAVLMFIMGILYRIHGDRAFVTAALKGVAAAAVGLILYTVVGLSKKSLAGKFDFVFMALAVISVNRLHLGVPLTLVAVGILAILYHRPRRKDGMTH